MNEPEQIRDEIDQAREELGDTVAAVSEKSDVKGQAQAKATAMKDRMAARAEENPSLAFAGVFAAGFILGRLLSR